MPKREPSPGIKLLVRLHEEHEARFTILEDGYPDSFKQRIGMEKEELDEAVDYLTEMGLLVKQQSLCRLTLEGFEVAREHAQAERQHATNEQVAFFTVILGLATIVQAAAAAAALESTIDSIALLTIVGLIAIFVAVYNNETQKAIGESENYVRGLFSNLYRLISGD